MAGRPRRRSAGIVGTGLIGTSIALGLRQRGWRVLGYDCDSGAVATAASMGAIERPVTTIEALARQVALVVVAVPPSRTVAVSRVALAAGALAVTDVASVKHPIVAALGDDPAFLGSHPIAGREKHGPEAATADLFAGSTWALSRTEATDPRTVGKVLSAVEALGAEPMMLDAASHDRMLAVSSHAPHAVAAGVALALANAPDAVAISQVLGSGWRGLTRVAGGDPKLWTDILRSNRRSVLTALDAVAVEIDRFREALRSGDVHTLRHMLERAAIVRGALEPRSQSAGIQAFRTG